LAPETIDQRKAAQGRAEVGRREERRERREDTM